MMICECGRKCVLCDSACEYYIEVEPVVHQKWLLVSSDPLEPLRFICAECGWATEDTLNGKPIANFCPNCGSKMDLE